MKKVVEDANADGSADEKLREETVGVKEENVIKNVSDVESVGADWCEIKGAEMPMLMQTQG